MSHERSNACLTDEVAYDFSLGKFRPDEIDCLAAHVSECVLCETKIGEFDTFHDPLLVALRQPEPAIKFEHDASFAAGLASAEQWAIQASRKVAKPTREIEDAGLGFVGQYQLLEKINQGGMGTIYKAMHTSLKRCVALKELPADRLEHVEAVARFQREMEAVGQLDHPNIVRAHDAGEYEGRHYLAMELVQGVDLSVLSRRLGPLPIADSCELVRQAALGLQHAHEHGMVHRDIKPANLMLTPAGGVKLLDLGLALLRNQQDADRDALTQSGQVMGTLDYMAPEQAGASHQVDIRADIYSLGATLYRLLTARTPLGLKPDVTPLRKLSALANNSINSIQMHRPEISDELAAIVHRMLNRQPGERHSTPAEVAEALSTFAMGADPARLLGLIPSSDNQNSPGRVTAPTDFPNSSVSSDTQIGHPPPTKTYVSSFQPAIRESVKQPQVGGIRYRRIVAITVAAVLLAAVIYFGTGKGRVEITVNEPGTQVTIDGQTPTNVVITETNGEEIVVKVTDLPSGRHVMQVTKDGFTTKTQEFWIVRNGRRVLTATLKPRDVAVSAETSTKAIREHIIDDGDRGYTDHTAGANDWGSGTSKELSQASFGRDYRFPNKGSRAARWSFNDVTPDRYEVFVTWPASSDGARVAVFNIICDGDQRRRIKVDQRRTPDDAEANGVSWKSLGSYQCKSGNLVVELDPTISAHGACRADAVRIVTLGREKSKAAK